MIALFLAAAALPAFQDTVSLDRAVAAFTGHSVGDEGGARTGIDTRLRLRLCPTVALSWRSEAHDAVVVACSGPDWRLFVPVRTPPVQAAAPASSSAVSPIVARPAAMARAEPVIRRGDPVVIEAGSNGFAISREGTALADAAPGARLFVRVEDAKAPVQAIALAGGRAILPGWGQ